jgi:hypothetical protein
MASLLSVERVWGDGYHNAFTDLKRWKGHYYLSFRVAQTHGMPPNGDAVLLRSADLSAWEPCARINSGGDDRDPKLVDAGDRLGLSFGTWFARWGDGTRSVRSEVLDLITHVTLSRDGRCWSAPQQVYGVNYWLWRILPAEGRYWCAAYHFARRNDRQMRSVHLLESADLLDWRLRGVMREGGGCGEPVLYQPAPGVLHCVIRSLEPDHHSWLGRSEAPYARWEWRDLGVMIHAPVVLRVGDDWICAGRSQPRDLPAAERERAPNTSRTSVWRLNGWRAEHLLTVPSSGDCSYCGLEHGPRGEVLMSYYSQHERELVPGALPVPADVFLARFTL